MSETATKAKERVAFAVGMAGDIAIAFVSRRGGWAPLSEVREYLARCERDDAVSAAVSGLLRDKLLLLTEDRNLELPQ